MRILVIADIHANWPALQAVIAQPHDICLCLGDLVDYGLEPAPCIGWVRDKVKYIVRGNHDHGVAQDVRTSGRTGFKYLTGATRTLTRELVKEDDLRYLSRLPLSRMVTFDSTRYLLVHATPRDPLDEYAPPDEEFWKRRLQNIEAEVVCVGHTHIPYVLEVADKLDRDHRRRQVRQLLDRSRGDDAEGASTGGVSTAAVRRREGRSSLEARSAS